MPDVPSLEAKRWEKVKDPNEHKPIDALKAMVRDIESGELDPTHVLIVYTTGDNESGHCGYYQAGNLEGYYAQLGLLTRCIQIME